MGVARLADCQISGETGFDCPSSFVSWRVEQDRRREARVLSWMGALLVWNFFLSTSVYSPFDSSKKASEELWTCRKQEWRACFGGA